MCVLLKFQLKDENSNSRRNFGVEQRMAHNFDTCLSSVPNSLISNSDVCGEKGGPGNHEPSTLLAGSFPQ